MAQLVAAYFYDSVATPMLLAQATREQIPVNTSLSAQIGDASTHVLHLSARIRGKHIRLHMDILQYRRRHRRAIYQSCHPNCRHGQEVGRSASIYKRQPQMSSPRQVKALSKGRLMAVERTAPSLRIIHISQNKSQPHD